MFYEFSLRGQIPVSNESTLRRRLERISKKETPFQIHRIVYKNNDTRLQVDLESSDLDKDPADREWSLINLGKVDTSIIRTVTTRTILRSKLLDGDIFSFINCLGLAYQFELVYKGYEFQFETLKIQVYRLYKCSDVLNSENIFPYEENVIFIKAFGIGVDTEANSLQTTLHSLKEKLSDILVLEFIAPEFFN